MVWNIQNLTCPKVARLLWDKNHWFYLSPKKMIAKSQLVSVVWIELELKEFFKLVLQIFGCDEYFQHVHQHQAPLQDRGPMTERTFLWNIPFPKHQQSSHMKSNSLIIDLSIDQGGCIATAEITTHSKPIFRKYDVIHYCVPNVASRVAHTATTALSNIFTPTILRAAEEGGVEEMIFLHKWFMKGVYTYKGGLTNESVARKFGMKYRNIELLLAARV